MSALLKIQRALQNHFLEPKSAALRASLDSIVIDDGNVSREVRLNIYANAYRVRLVEALSVDFGILHAYLGDEVFAELVSAYIDSYPSHYFSLRDVGGEMVSFLKVTAPYAQHIELHELAMFEWALCHAFDALDTHCASAADFSVLPPEQWPELRLSFVPSLGVIALRSNTPELWKALNSGKTPPPVEITGEIKFWLVWRHDLKLLFRPFGAAEKYFFDIFRCGKNFSEVCDSLADHFPEGEIPQRAAAILRQWVNDGLVVS